MKRRGKIALLAGAVALIGALGAGALVVGQTKVPPEAIRNSVIRSEAAIEQAWQLPAASTFRREVTWQSNVSRCGPASVANVLRSLGEPAASEAQVLAGTWWCWTGVCVMGLTLDELAEVAQAKTQRKVTVLRDLGLEDFRAHLRRANDPQRRYIINFRRTEIFGAGAGHHSPIGGYLEAEDLVFVLDVNRDYQPWLIEAKRLHAAMDTLDGSHKRGLLLIE
jgi:hypothetical protein